MATNVLIHGHNMSTETWHTLTIGDPIHKEDSHPGGQYWEGTVFAHTAHHYLAFAPTLKDEHSSNLTDPTEQICTLIIENDLKDVVLIGHSYGGMVVTGVAAKGAGVTKKKIATNGKDWTYSEIPSWHMPMADMPDEFYRLMLDSAKELQPIASI